MIQANLRSSDGELIASIPLPESLAEMRLAQFVNFTTHAAKEGNAIEVMLKAVSEFAEMDLEQLAKAKVGNIYTEVENLDDTLRSLYGYISNLITSFEPALRTELDHKFTYQGQEYLIPIMRTVPLITGVVLPDLSVGEAVESLEVLRTLDLVTKENGDPEGSERFTAYLKLLAILARKEGEKLPVKDAERERFIRERLIHFQGIDAKTALDIDFFFKNLLGNSKPTNSITGFFTARAIALGVETQSWKWRHTNVPKSTTAKSSKPLVGGS